MIYLQIAGVAAFLLVLVAALKPKAISIAYPGYTIANGIALGAFSVMVATRLGTAIVAQGAAIAAAIFMLLVGARVVRLATPWRRAGREITWGSLAAGVYYVYVLTRRSWREEAPNPASVGAEEIGLSLAIIALAIGNLALGLEAVDLAAPVGESNSRPDSLAESGAGEREPSLRGARFAGLRVLVSGGWLYLETIRLLSLFREP